MFKTKTTFRDEVMAERAKLRAIQQEELQKYIQPIRDSLIPRFARCDTVLFDLYAECKKFNVSEAGMRSVLRNLDLRMQTEQHDRDAHKLRLTLPDGNYS